MSDLKRAQRNTGYSQEEKFFNEHNRALIEKIKSRGWRVIQGGANGHQDSSSPGKGGGPDRSGSGSSKGPKNSNSSRSSKDKKAA